MNESIQPGFAHERLEVYRQSLEFIRWTETIWSRLPKGFAATSQLDRARTSIPLNIAEGNGKSRIADKCKFLDIAHGSVLECAACLDVLCLEGSIQGAEAREGKLILSRLVRLLIGLINSKAPDHWCAKEDLLIYGNDEEPWNATKAEEE